MASNGSVSKIYFFLAVIFAAYFAALEIAAGYFLFSFSGIWLLAAFFFLGAGILVSRRKKDGAYRLLEGLPKKAKRIIYACFFAGLSVCLFNLFFILTPKTADLDSACDAPYLIVLGGGVTQKGELTALQTARINLSAAYLKAHPKSKAVVTGGQLRHVKFAEAPVMARYLAAAGVEPERIIQEGKAHDTIQNFEYSAEKISLDAGIPVQDVPGLDIIVVTSRFHMARAERISRRMGFKSVQGLACRTPALYVPNSYLREILAYVKLDLRILFTGRPEAL